MNARRNLDQQHTTVSFLKQQHIPAKGRHHKVGLQLQGRYHAKPLMSFRTTDNYYFDLGLLIIACIELEQYVLPYEDDPHSNNTKDQSDHEYLIA